LDDLVQAGALGLIDAATKYNSEKQVTFSSYAKHRIKGAMLDSLRQLDWATRDMRRQHKQVDAATEELTTKLQRAPTEAEIAQKVGVDVEQFRTWMVALRVVDPVSVSARPRVKEDLPTREFSDKPEGQPDWIRARAELREALAHAITNLPERYQTVILLYYRDEMNMKEIGLTLGVKESRVSQIHTSALEKMAVTLGTIGITSPSQCMFSTSANSSS
jgi:RNA polymerase sigma factor for flagellar operon FliA